MDSKGNDTVNQMNKDAIIAAIRGGSLTVETISSRLNEMVDYEVGKKEPNFELIRICEELLWELNAPNAIIDDKEDSKRALIAKLDRKETSKRRFILPIRKIALLAAAAALVITIGVYGGGQWLTGQSTEDEQKYLVTGVVVDPSVIHKGNAEVDRSELREIRTTDIEEVTLFLGYTPRLLAYAPEGMQLKRYNAGILPTMDDFSAMYVAEDGTTTVYSFIRYLDADSVRMSHEQDKQGTEIKIANTTVYCSTNIDHNIFVWFDGMDHYNVSSALPADKMLELVTETILQNGGIGND